MIPQYEWDGYHELFRDPELLARVKKAEHYAARMLPYIPRGLPVYQSHGVGHSLVIIRRLSPLWAALLRIADAVDIRTGVHLKYLL
ncbi:MAG: hypothetical protein CVV33_06690 [Methanomicrobiales archaeon HGW-Methanomicrobiales-4]|nr:MAG: hypothetical protein CVV33_06690 [Methanomicrobiales archaeon HGW-Methanomicrobiales-4]